MSSSQSLGVRVSLLLCCVTTLKSLGLHFTYAMYQIFFLLPSVTNFGPFAGFCCFWRWVSRQGSVGALHVPSLSLTLLALLRLLLRCSMPQISLGYLPIPVRPHCTTDPIVCTGARPPERSRRRKGEAGRGEGNGLARRVEGAGGMAPIWAGLLVP